MCETNPSWVPVDQQAAEKLTKQLKNELSKGHPLWGVPFSVLKQCESCDDILLKRTDTNEQWVCHLTWGGRQNAPWPVAKPSGWMS